MLGRRAIVLGLSIAVIPVASSRATPAPVPPSPPPGIEAGPGAEPDLHRGDNYLGENNFFRLSSVVIVYPTGPGENVTVNRLSAESRARYLEVAQGMKARVVADDAVSEADRNDNLLVLGWSNRLFGSAAAPAPFKRTEDGFEFLGMSLAIADADLLLYNRSPFNGDRILVFWSRIDPERDRQMFLPRVGSDWAIYDGYRIALQGMCRPGRAWPPRLDTEAMADHRSELLQSRRHRTVRKGRGVDVFYDADLVSEEEIGAIVRARETALARATGWLGPLPDDARVTIDVSNDEAAKKKFFGLGGEATSVPADREIHMTRRAARAGSPHEEVHVLARARYGPCFLTAMYEGLPPLLEENWKGVDPMVSALLLRERKGLPSLEVLLDEARISVTPESVAMPGSVALVGWLRSLPGKDTFSRAYGLQEGTVAALAKALGRPDADLGAEFERWLDGQSASRRADLAFAKAQIDAQARFAIGDFAGMAQVLKRALEAKPGDAQTQFNLASAQMRAGALREAEGVLDRMLAQTSPALDSRFVIFGHYQLGRVYDLEGEREKALAEYRKVLDLPDQHDAHRLAQERIASPATPEQLD